MWNEKASMKNQRVCDTPLVILWYNPGGRGELWVRQINPVTAEKLEFYKKQILYRGTYDSTIYTEP